GSIDEVRAPTPEPRTVRFLGPRQPAEPTPRGPFPGASFPGEHLHHVRGHVGAGRVDHGAEVTEGKLVGELAGVVRVKRAPPAVPAASSSAQSAARRRAGSFPGTPASESPMTASAVSHTGDWHASSRRPRSSWMVKPSRPSKAARITGWSMG